MTTTQAVPNGHRLSPPFSPSEIADAPSPVAPVFPDAQPAAPAADPYPAPEREKVSFAASAYHVPPACRSPRADGDPDDDIRKNPGKLPWRCQFMFSDGRQCTMDRSDVHPSLCTYHSDREEQLFGDPTYPRVSRNLDFPELYSASRDLTTAAGVNRALAQVFRLLAMRRISRQEASTFAKLGQLLLQSIRAAHAEATDCVIPETTSPISATTFADRAEIGRSGQDEDEDNDDDEDEESRAASPTHAASACAGVQSRRRNGVEHASATSHFQPDVNPHICDAQLPPITAVNPSTRPATPGEPFTGNGPLRKDGWQLPHNQHLRDRGTSSHSESALAEKWKGE